MTKSKAQQEKERDAGRGYSEGEWAGKPNYRCAECAYDTVNRDEIEAHVANAHGRTRTEQERQEAAEEAAEESS